MWPTLETKEEMALQPQQRPRYQPIKLSNSVHSRRPEAVSFPGIYKLTIATAMAALQPKEVQPFFGAHGESLTGRQVLTLEGTSERIFWQTLQFKINTDGSISSSPPNPSSNPPSDEHAIGSTDEKWQKVQGTDPAIYAMTNVGFSQGGIVVMYIVENLPESDIVDAPQSVEYDIWGNCAARQYTVISSLFYSEKNRGGYSSGRHGGRGR